MVDDRSSHVLIVVIFGHPDICMTIRALNSIGYSAVNVRTGKLNQQRPTL